jgi:copper-containing nitrite reductase
MKPSIHNPIWTAILFVATLLVMMRLASTPTAFSNVRSGAVGIHQPPVLEPKDALKTEPAEWAFAPNVPPPITRKDQRRVVVNWDIEETQAEIAPGVIYDDYWGFNGKVPGPILRVREGDLVEVHLTNNIKSMRSHNIDFHFVSGPGGGASALNVAPGQTAVLEARAMAPGFYMFHCASPDIPMHIANGMYGFVLVEPAEGLPKVDKEIYMVQSEIYTTDDKTGHQHFSMERGEKADPQYIVFNGAKGSMLKDKAPHAEIGQSVRIYAGNAGPNLVSSFHVIGQIFDKVFREGDLISPPEQGVQTTLIPAGGSAVVEFTPRVPGTLLMVDHSIFRLHRGAAASLVVDGQKTAQTAEIYNPVTAASGPEMSADAHLGGAPAAMPTNHAGMQGMDHSKMSGMNRDSAPAAEQPAHAVPNNDALQPGGGSPISEIHNWDIPPASDDKAIQAAMASAAATPKQDAEPAPAAPGNTIAILPGAGNYGSGTNAYGPDVMTVKRGTAVTWVNNDAGMVHNVAGVGGTFTSTLLREGQSWTHVFSKPGTYPYTCLPHPWMKGTLIVK